MAELTCDIDGTDISEICQSQSFRPRLNLLDSYVIRFPSFLFPVAPGVMELHGYLDGDLVFSGPVWFMQPDGGADSAYTEVTAYDHRVYLGKRLAKWDDGGQFNLINPCPVFVNNVKAPLILEEFIQNAIDDPDVADFDPNGPEGPFGPAEPLPLALGTVDSGGENVDSCPMDFPMSIQRIASLLVATGQLDMVLHPGIGSSTVDLLNHYDNDISGSVVFEYATGAHNSTIASVTVDMEDMVTALWFLLGPRGPRTVVVDGKIKHIPKNHWGGSITPTAPNGAGDIWDASLLNLIGNSRAIYGYMQEVQIHDDNGDEQTIRRTFEEWWAAEAEVRALPREFLSIRPERGLVPSIPVGSRIGAVAGATLNGGVLGFGGDQIVYGYNLDQDTEVASISEIITSADQSLTG
jgi:hypothetical protein